MLKESWKVYAGGDAKDPDASLAIEYDIAHVEAKAEDFVGDDGRRIGFSKSAKVGAEWIGGKVVGTMKVDPFGVLDHFGLSLDIHAEAGPDLGGLGAGAGAEAYYDKKDERVNLGVMGKLAVAVGLKGDFKISFGKKKKASGGSGSPGAGAGGVPNLIVLGEFTVLIGP